MILQHTRSLPSSLDTVVIDPDVNVYPAVQSARTATHRRAILWFSERRSGSFDVPILSKLSVKAHAISNLIEVKNRTACMATLGLPSQGVNSSARTKNPARKFSNGRVQLQSFVLFVVYYIIVTRTN